MSANVKRLVLPAGRLPECARSGAYASMLISMTCWPLSRPYPKVGRLTLTGHRARITTSIPTSNKD